MTTNELRTKRLSAQYKETIEALHKPGKIDVSMVEKGTNELWRLRVVVHRPTYLVGKNNKPVPADKTEFFIKVEPYFESEVFIAFFRDTAHRVCHPHVWRNNVICIGDQTNYTGMRDVTEKCVRLCVFDPGISNRSHPPACNDFHDWYWKMLSQGKFPTANLQELLGPPQTYRQPRTLA